jgi:hypothetical protein
VLVNAWADGNPEYNENASNADQAKGNSTPSYVNWQHSCHESVDSEKLVSYISAGISHKKTEGDTPG